MIKSLFYQLRYSLKCWIYLPITFIKRIILGKNKPHKRFFWDKWGFLPQELVRGLTSRNTIWIVANSGGEVTQSVSFLERLKTKFPDYRIVISTESYDTFKYAQTLKGVDCVFFPPWDIPFCCKRVLTKIKPKVLIFIEHCYFPVLVKIAKRLKVKTLYCSGMVDFHFLKKNFLLQRAFALQFYKFIDRFAVKNQQDLDNLVHLGVAKEKILVLGNMKFDLEHILLSEDRKDTLEKELALSERDLVFFVGSLHQGETDLILDAFSIVRKKFPHLKLFLASRWVNDITFIEQKIGNSYIYRRRSQVLSSKESGNYDILIIDTFGELPYLYGIASVVFIASSIVPINVRRLGHNIFEPLVHGVPILFGPHMNLWRKITEPIKESWSGCEVKDMQTLANSINNILTNVELTERLRKVFSRINKPNFGIVDRHLEFVDSAIR